MPSLALDLAGSTRRLPNLRMSTPALPMSRPKLNDLIMLQTTLKTTLRRPNLCPSLAGSVQKITSHQRYISSNSLLTNNNYSLCILSPTLKLSSGPPGSQRSSTEKLAPPSAIRICQQEPSKIGKHSIFQRGTSISALSKIHGHSVIQSQKHSAFGITCFPTTRRHLLERENRSSTW